MPKRYPSFLPTPPFPNDSLQAALAASVIEGTFTDTAYRLFSRRLANGKVGGLQTVYASSTVLKAAGDYFEAQLSGSFSVNKSIPKDTDSYGYESDSDIDDSEYVGNDICAMPESEEDGVNHEEADSSIEGDSSSDSKEQKSTLGYERIKDKSVKYNVVVPDIAADTWQALIYYIYTGTVCFAPLRSQGLNERRSTVSESRQDKSRPPLCSPKSMYRVADIIGFTHLKAAAERDLKSKLSAETIVEEVFSRFSPTYPEILEMQLQFLYTNATMSEVTAGIHDKIKAVVQGQLPHAENVLNTLLLRLSSLLVEHGVGKGSCEGKRSEGDSWFTEISAKKAERRAK
ncbi:hypothetical protein PHLCEN_2v15 [Hermanssonia centrifuga]|uniref:BTB domain-containing protein n=1 Tax=Hermanssonia centrifuga TaxID=98765 RepID=A0A2R6S7A7_9APHY|nr:hypothetical protein PHLCEN_2v15 [Hermanssonia centrifuga]